MTRLTLLTIGLAAIVCAFYGVNCDGLVQTLELSNIDVGFDVTDSRNQVNLGKTVEVNKNVTELIAQYSSGFSLQPRQATSSTNRVTITYKLGQRINGEYQY